MPRYTPLLTGLKCYFHHQNSHKDVTGVLCRKSSPYCNKRDTLQFVLFSTLFLYPYFITLNYKNWHKFTFPIFLCNYVYVVRSYENQGRLWIEMAVLISSVQKLQPFSTRIVFVLFFNVWTVSWSRNYLRCTCSQTESDSRQASHGLPLIGQNECCRLEWNDDAPE